MPTKPAVVDFDGHLLESKPDLTEFAPPSIRDFVVNGSVAQQGVFPCLDGIHSKMRADNAPVARDYVSASDERRGSGEDWRTFLDKAEIERSVLYPTEGLAVGLIQNNEYAIPLCRAYNDYVAERYRRVSDRLHPAAMLPMQDAEAAVLELRRAVKDLGLPGAMLPSAGLPLHLAHDYYFPIYKEAATLGCGLGIHGAPNRGMGVDTFSNFIGSHVLHHPLPLMIAMVAFVYHGVLDRLPDLKLGFLEGGCGWLVCLLDRSARNDEFFGRAARKTLADYLTTGQLVIGCEGNDPSLPYLAKRIGINAFAFSSDYPHEVDLVGVRHEIEETLQSAELSQSEKEAVLGGNARRFFGF